MIKDNYFDLYNLSYINQTYAKNYNEPPTAIFVAEIFERWLSDCSEVSGDNIEKYLSINLEI